MKLGQLHEASALSRIKDSVPHDTVVAHQTFWATARADYMNLLVKMIESAGFTDAESDFKDDAATFSGDTIEAKLHGTYPVYFHLSESGASFVEVEAVLFGGEHVFRQRNVKDLKKCFAEIESYARVNGPDEDD